MVCLKPVDKYSLTTQHYVTLHYSHSAYVLTTAL